MTIQKEKTHCRKCLNYRVAAILLWTVVLAVASLSPASKSFFLFRGQDKVLHFLAYLLTAVLACRSLQFSSLTVAKTVAISAVYSIIIGGLLEVLQRTMTSSRQGDWFDFWANLAGIACGCAIFCLYRRLSSDHYE